MTIGKSVSELQDLLWLELKDNPACKNVTGVVVGRSDKPGSETNWRIIGYGFDGNAVASPYCKRAGIAAFFKLSRQYHLLTDD